MAKLHCCIKSDSYNHGRNFRGIVLMLRHVAIAPGFSSPRYSESFGELKFVHAGQNTAYTCALWNRVNYGYQFMQTNTQVKMEDYFSTFFFIGKAGICCSYCVGCCPFSWNHARNCIVDIGAPSPPKPVEVEVVIESPA